MASEMTIEERIERFKKNWKGVSYYSLYLVGFVGTVFCLLGFLVLFEFLELESGQYEFFKRSFFENFSVFGMLGCILLALVKIWKILKMILIRLDEAAEARKKEIDGED